jgi:integrase
MIYKTAILTGLRRGELGSLGVQHLNLAEGMLNLPGEFTKNGRDAALPLRGDLIEDLRTWLAETAKEAGELVFEVPAQMNKILKRDLAWAGIPYRDDLGRVFDFHSLRHTMASHMGKKKVAPRIAQKLLRHSDIKLTMQTYTDERLLDEAEALAALPDLPLPGEDGPMTTGAHNR